MEYCKFDCVLFGSVFDEMQYRYSVNNRYKQFYSPFKKAQYIQAKNIMNWYDELDINFILGLQQTFNYFMYRKSHLKVQPLLFPANLSKDYIQETVANYKTFKSKYHSRVDKYHIMFPILITATYSYLLLRKKYSAFEIATIAKEYKVEIINEFKTVAYSNSYLEEVRKKILSSSNNDQDLYKLYLKFFGIDSIPSIIFLFDDESFNYINNCDITVDYYGYLCKDKDKNKETLNNINLEFYKAFYNNSKQLGVEKWNIVN